MKCKICRNKEATQSGSHITSAFLLTSQIGKRGEERGYLISTNPDQDYTENKGDEGIKEDYLFCPDCEKRLGVVENIYATEITQKIEDKKFEQNFIKTDFDKEKYLLECNRISPIVFQLLIQSNVWRASLSNQQIYGAFKLSDEIENKVNSNLDLFLPNVEKGQFTQSTKDWLKLIDECNELFDFLPFALIKAENIENKEMTYEYFDNISKSPYHIILNEYFILLFDNDLNWSDDFFELNSEFDINSIINNNNNPPRIAVVSNAKYMHVIDKLKKLAIEQKLEKIEKECIKEHYRYGIPITPESVKQMMIKKVNERKPE